MNNEEYVKIHREQYEQIVQQRFYNRIADEQFYRTTAVRRYWRPAMAWLYFLVCAFDFLIAPIIMINLGKTWMPLTANQNGFAFHLAMGTIVGVTAWGRSQEKVAEPPFWTPYGGVNQTNIFAPPVAPTMVNNAAEGVKDGLSSNEDEIIPPKKAA